MEKMIEKGKVEAKKSAKDWYGYIQDHPLQSMFFGLTVFFALKGLLKN
jgi:hypothetical protein